MANRDRKHLLLWISGKSRTEIAEMTGDSVLRVSFHLDQARAALGCAGREAEYVARVWMERLERDRRDLAVAMEQRRDPRH